MKLTIILVSYNEKKYLKDSIESCLAQECKFPFEIVIGDDGSDDGSIDIICNYAKCYPNKISYFVMDRNETDEIIPSLRVSNLIKRGLKEARGEYISLLSGDDLFIDKYKSQKQVEFLEKNKRYASCFTNYMKFWDDGKKELAKKCITLSRSLFWARHYVHISCFVFRKNVENNLLDRFCDDTGLIYSILVVGRSKYIPITGFAYRQRDCSIVHEADIFELNLLELSLMQDIMNHGCYRFSSMSRFSNAIEYVYNNREVLEKLKYKKYIKNCEKYDNNYIGLMADYDNLTIGEKKRLRKLVYTSKIVRYIFKIVT